MPKGYDVWQKTFYDRAIQTSLGIALRAEYDLSAPMPDRLSQLLQELEALEQGQDDEAQETGSGPGPGRPGPGRPGPR